MKLRALRGLKVWVARSCMPCIDVLENRFSTNDGRPSRRPTGLITNMKEDFGGGYMTIWEEIHPKFVWGLEYVQTRFSRRQIFASLADLIPKPPRWLGQKKFFQLTKRIPLLLEPFQIKLRVVWSILSQMLRGSQGIYI